MTDLSIVIPALNEAKRLPKTLIELKSYVNSDSIINKLNLEIIIAVADSQDNTIEIAENFVSKNKNFRVIKPGPKVGKGRDIREGVLSAKGRYILFMDADMATPLHYISKFYVLCQKNQIIIGSRDLKKHHKSIFRHSVSNIGNILFKILSGVWVNDSQCGFKMFSRAAARKCFKNLHILGWGFDMEILSIARIKNYKIVELPIDDWRDVAGGSFNENLIINSIRSLRDLIYIFIYRIYRVYE